MILRPGSPGLRILGGVEAKAALKHICRLWSRGWVCHEASEHQDLRCSGKIARLIHKQEVHCSKLLFVSAHLTLLDRAGNR